MAVYGVGSNLFGNCVPPVVSTALDVLTPTLIPDAASVVAASFSQTVLQRSDGSRLVLGLETPVLPPLGVLLGLDDFSASLADGELRGLMGGVHQSIKLAAMNGRGELLVVRDGGEIELHESLDCALTPPADYTPATFATPSPPIVALAAGASHFLLLTPTSVLSLGTDNRFSQLGHSLPSSTPRKLETIDFFEGLQPALVAAGGLHSIVVTADGAAYAFGSDREGQCGGSGGGEPTLVELGEGAAEDQPGVVGVACGSAHSVLVTQSGVWVAGANQAGQLGLGDREPRRAFVEVPEWRGSKSVRVICSRWATFVEVED